MASVINAVGHGFAINDPFRFANLVPDNTGIDENATYYVIAAGFGANAFEFSETLAGVAFVLTNAITDGSLYGPNIYVENVDGTMNAPTPPATPTNPTVTSALVTDSTGGVLVHLKVTIIP